MIDYQFVWDISKTAFEAASNTLFKLWAYCIVIKLAGKGLFFVLFIFIS